MANEIARRVELTDLQAAFVRHLESGCNPTQAATLAGYSVESAASASSHLLRAPHVLAAVQAGVRRKLVTGAPMALNLILSLVGDKLAHPKLRFEAARDLLSRAGHVAPRAVAESQAHAAALHEMTLGDLRTLADRLESEIADRAKDVSGAVAAPIEAQAFDLVG